MVYSTHSDLYSYTLTEHTQHTSLSLCDAPLLTLCFHFYFLSLILSESRTTCTATSPHSLSLSLKHAAITLNIPVVTSSSGEVESSNNQRIKIKTEKYKKREWGLWDFVYCIMSTGLCSGFLQTTPIVKIQHTIDKHGHKSPLFDLCNRHGSTCLNIIQQQQCLK